MKISLCMITKDEEKSLPKSLDSVVNYVDEIIIIDTGSTDDTIKIAQKFGAKVFQIKWQNDFSIARNHGLEKANGEWILYLDADEILEHGELLKKLIEKADKDIEGFLFNIINYTDESLTHSEKSVSLRLFRNKPELRFFGAIHEQLPIKDKFVAMTELIIHHFGYLPSINKDKKKSKRNLEILQAEIKKNPTDGFTLYNLASEYLRLHQFNEAIHYYKKALKHTDQEIGYESRLYKMLGISLLESKQLVECKNYLDEGINKYPDYPDLYYIRGLCLEAAKKYQSAIKDFSKCLSMRHHLTKNNKIYVTEDGITSYKPLQKIKEILLDNLPIIPQLLEIKIEQEIFDTIPFLAGSLWLTGDVDEAKKIIYKTNSPELTYMKVTVILLEFAKMNLIKGLKNYPDSLLLKEEYERVSEWLKNIDDSLKMDIYQPYKD
ncbi:hypothetical protein BHF71_02900 [Vulcanibacillus modesticaldus]|uniref:Glycosyltransferase 2-like domain-containing protein n=1 Tax=Vulcanibacillus modesticaldus TaxID=337097 RepID=A0A1D2YT71_9BACI|nr:glycosyltransferase family 2 protein [Vulcanibacillus modesticaldus]OEF98892.1 hypothetical protein BHF71_02900 [Vulcanibacillus modesticaldus]